jgi:hypothetical protein
MMMTEEYCGRLALRQLAGSRQSHLTGDITRMEYSRFGCLSSDDIICGYGGKLMVS